MGGKCWFRQNLDLVQALNNHGYHDVSFQNINIIDYECP